MMMKRKGLGKGMGKGYYNIVPMDSHIHSLSAKGVKTRLCACKNKKLNAKGKNVCNRCKNMLGKKYFKTFYGEKYCERCRQKEMEEMLKAKGLDPKITNKEYINKVKQIQNYKFVKDVRTNKSYPRIKYGDEEDGWDTPKYCPDCGVAKGMYHHPNCDIERSPIPDEKGLQLLSSDYAGDFSIDAKGKKRMNPVMRIDNWLPERDN